MKNNTNLIQNIIWLIKLNLKHVPFVTFTRIVGFINSNAANLLRAFLLGFVIDWAIEYVNSDNPDDNLIIYSLLVFAGYYAIVTLANILRSFGENLVGFRMNSVLPQVLLHEKLNKLKIADLESPDLQNKLNRLRENRYVINEMSRNMLMIISGLISILIALIPLIGKFPFATLIVCLTAIPAILVNKYIFKKLWTLDKDTTVLNRKGWSTSYSIADPGPMKEVKLVGAYGYIRRFFDEYATTYDSKKRRIYTDWSLFDIGTNALSIAALLFGLYQIIMAANDSEISIGQTAFYTAAMSSLGNFIDTLSAYGSSFINGNTRLTEMREILNYPEEDNSNKLKIEKLNSAPVIEFKNVKFKYPNAEKFTIKDLNLKINPGEKIAIVGENGAGKTTLVKLISNIYSATEGEVLVDGKNLKDIEENSWFENLGVLFQDYNSYSDLTALENIAIGRINTDKIDYEAAVEAAKKADADEFIMEFENNYSQILSERYEGGIRPSTGQWQKLAIARFFYRNSPVLILDEPTASIDAVAEANIFNRIYEFIQDKTVIIISHRFSTVRNADRIIVFDKGKIIEEGPHDKLINQGGKYANAFKLQAKGYE